MSVAMTLLFGGVLLVAAVGTGGHPQRCDQEDSRSSVSVAEIERTSARAFGDTRESPPAAQRVRSSDTDSEPGPTCGPGGPLRMFASALVRSVRVPDHADWGPQQEQVFSLDDVSRLVEERAEDEPQQSSAAFISRAQGTLGTVRSVVLRV